ncbi:MAG: protein-disulfide reductase DsbD family protein [Candidatus Kapabacteria bacterium]|nr:protein-disulfide reductase DsbD family protein [Candidatus Kapabacteria bacterium]
MNIRPQIRAIVLVLLVGLFVADSGYAQLPSGKDYISISPIPEISGKAGDTVTILLKMKIDKGWHTYGVNPKVGPDGLGPDATVITVGPKSTFRLAGRPKVVKGLKIHYDSTWAMDIEELYGSVEFSVRVIIDKRLKKGSQKAEVMISAQVCDAKECFPYEDFQVPVEKVIVTSEFVGDMSDTTDGNATAVTKTSALPGEPTKTSITTAGPAKGVTEIEVEQQKGLWSFFFYAMGIGFLALLTPCVFPMIPITVSFFTKRHEKQRGKGFQESLLFGLGIVSTFTAVGIPLSELGYRHAVYCACLQSFRCI